MDINIAKMNRQEFDEWVKTASKPTLAMLIFVTAAHLRMMSVEDGDQYEEFLLLSGRKEVLKAEYRSR